MLTKLFKRNLSPNLEDPRVPLTGKNVADALFWDAAATSSGLRVGTNESLSCSPVWAGVDLISSDVTRLPWRVMLKDGETHREDPDHPVQKLIAVQNDPYSLAYEWRLRIMCHALLHGNAYARISWRAQSGRTIADRLEFIHSDKVTPRREQGRRFFEVTYNGFEDGREGWEVVEWDDMYHLQGLTLNELGGLSLVAYARNTVARQLSASMYGDDFFKNLAVPQGFFSHPQRMSEPAQERFLKQMERRFQSTGNRFRLGFLEEGMKWESTGINPRDAMLIDLMDWGVPDVARFFGIPPHKLGDREAKGYNTTEQENQSYFNSTLGKWTMRLKGEAIKLFSSGERESYYTAFDLDELLSANTKDRFDGYNSAIQAGWMTRNEARRKENLNPIDGLDEPVIQVNMTGGTDVDADEGNADAAAGSGTAESTDPAAGVNAQRDERIRSAMANVLRDQLLRMATRVGRSVCRAAKEPSQFLGELNVLEDNHGEQVRAALLSVAGVLSSVDHTDCHERLDKLVDGFFSAVRSVFLEAAEVPPDDLEQSVTAAQKRLQERCQQMATQETTSKGDSDEKEP